ncbi:hypothetical protein ACFCV3_10315 [Kribbella sp. NPDC056345]|uniref:hypothetical protein n=1 Tax=Kribbella sp. NPDC056345 TaxID=3345789 RepID=UPI0035E236ED
MESSQFAGDLRRRVREARQALVDARAEGDFYAVDIRTGELDSLLRLAMENGVLLVDEYENADPGGER